MKCLDRRKLSSWLPVIRPLPSIFGGCLLVDEIRVWMLSVINSETQTFFLNTQFCVLDDLAKATLPKFINIFAYTWSLITA